MWLSGGSHSFPLSFFLLQLHLQRIIEPTPREPSQKFAYQEHLQLVLRSVHTPSSDIRPDQTPLLPCAYCSLRSSKRPFSPSPFHHPLIRGLIINPKISIHTAILIKTKQNKPKISSRCTWSVSSCILVRGGLTFKPVQRWQKKNISEGLLMTKP